MTFDFDLSRSLKVKSDGVIGLSTYGFLSMVNSNLGHNLAPLRNRTLDLDFDLSRSLKVKSDGAVRLPIMTSY